MKGESGMTVTTVFTTLDSFYSLTGIRNVSRSYKDSIYELS